MGQKKNGGHLLRGNYKGFFSGQEELCLKNQGPSPCRLVAHQRKTATSEKRKKGGHKPLQDALTKIKANSAANKTGQGENVIPKRTDALSLKAWRESGKECVAPRNGCNRL